MTKHWRRKRINRSALWILLPALSFGLIFPVIALQEEVPPPYPFVVELKGEEVKRVAYEDSKNSFQQTVIYRFYQSKEHVMSALLQKLKSPEWRAFPTQGFFLNRNGDQLLVSESDSTSCDVRVNIKGQSYVDFWDRFRTSIGL